MGVSVQADEFAGRVALVTGAAGHGIGTATATRLAAGGATVIVTDSHDGRLPHADDIAETIAFLASERAAHVTGEIVNVSSGSYMRS